MNKTDEIVIEKDKIHATCYRDLAKSTILTVKINENLEDVFIIATNFLENNCYRKNVK